MKQLLLRVPDDVHRRLATRAARAGQSINAVANEILDAAVDADQGDRRARLRARAATLGLLSSTRSPAVEPVERQRIIASAKGTGRVIDGFLNEERDRL